MAILGMMFLLNIVTFQVASTFPLSLRDLYHFSEAWIGVTLAVNTLIIILFEMVLIHSLARRDPLKVAGFGCFVSAPASPCCRSDRASATSSSRWRSGRWGRCWPSRC